MVALQTCIHCTIFGIKRETSTAKDRVSTLKKHQITMNSSDNN